MAGTRKSLAKYGPVILVITAAAHSAFAPLRRGVQASTAHSSSKALPPVEDKSASKKVVGSELTADQILAFGPGYDPSFPPLQNRLDRPSAKFPILPGLDPLPATTISLLNTSGVTAPISPTGFEPTLDLPVLKSEPVNLDPGGVPVSTAPVHSSDSGSVDSSDATPKQVPEPITFFEMLLVTALLGRPRHIIPV